MGPPTVVLDANVLFPAPVRDLYVRLAIAGVVRARWTEQILDETFRNILRVRPELDPSSLARTRLLMNRAVRDVMVVGFEHRIDTLDLPDADDRHVLAAAIECEADYIVTWNLRDFPSKALEGHGLTALSPDALLAMLATTNRHAVSAALTRQAGALKNPPMTVDSLRTVLTNNGLTESMALLAGS